MTLVSRSMDQPDERARPRSSWVQRLSVASTLALSSLALADLRTTLTAPTAPEAVASDRRGAEAGQGNQQGGRFTLWTGGIARSQAPAEGGVAGADCGSVELTQNLDPVSILPNNTATCIERVGAGFSTAENGHAREFVATEDVQLDCVTFGVQQNSGGPWAVEVLIHGGPIDAPYGSLPLLASTGVEIEDGVAGQLRTASFPNGGPTLAAGTRFVVELKVRSRLPQDGGDGGALFLGSNAAGESAPTYLRAPTCGLDGFVDVDGLGFPQTNIIINPGGNPTLPIFTCGSSGAGSCFIPHPTPACSDGACCQLLCQLLDPTCCTIAWDVNCVELAYGFGECTFQPPPCQGLQAYECRAGCRDGFGGSPDPAEPSAELLAALSTCNLLNDFDTPVIDACFAHTFTGCWPHCGVNCEQPGCGTIVGAILEVRLQSLGTIASNDTLSFWDNGTALFGVNIGAAAGNPTWPAGATATLRFNFGPNPIPGTIHVPPSTGVLASLCDGEFGLVMQDDTMIDHAALSVFVCPCDNPTLVTFDRDNADGFNGPTPTTPSTDLLATVTCGAGALQSYDVQALDACFVETITGLPTCINGATITIGVRPNSLWWTDGLAFEVVNECNSTFRWSLALSTLNTLGLFSPPLASGQLSTITLDLDNLPPSAGGVSSVLSELLDGSLDIYLQDDTGVDFISLAIASCEGCDGQAPTGACCLPPEVPGGSWHCSDLTEEQCEFHGGTWLGANVDCSQVQCNGPCTSPPWGMVAWLPLEPTTGLISDDITPYQNDGTYGPLLPAPPISGPGVVGGGYCFDGIDDNITIPPSWSLNFGCSPFSVDMWVIWSPSATPSFVSLIGQYAGAGGWVFGIDETTGQLEMLSESQCLRCIAFSTGTIVPNTWTHVAITVSGCPCGQECFNDPSRVVDFYIDGAFAGTGNACCNLTSQAGPASTVIGGSSWFAQPFMGCLDEIEIFNRELYPFEVFDIWNAGGAGKCKDRCHASWDRLVCQNVDMAWAAEITICNDSTSPRTYSWTVTESAACSITGVTYSPNSGVTTVGPGACVTVPIAVNATGASGFGPACFDLNVLNLFSGQSCTSMGMVWVHDCPVVVTPCDPILSVPLEQPTVIGFDVGNLNLPPVLPIKYEVFPSDMVSTSDRVSINGQPGGQPWGRVVNVPPGQVKLLTATVQFLAPDAFQFYDVILSIDIDGDGVFDPVSSIAIVQGPAPCVGDLTGDGVIDGADLATLLGAWGTGGSVADVNGDGVVDGADLATVLGAWGPCP